MGADIHPYVEVESDGDWFFVDSVPADRNYLLFSYLSGVRNGDYGVVPFFDVLDNSIASEFSDFVRKEFEHCNDYHSLTVCGHDALKRMYVDLKKQHESTHKKDGLKAYGKNALEQLEDWLAILTIYAKMFDNVRVVLWYDN